MELPNPREIITRKREERAIDKIRKKHDHSIKAKKKRHSSTKEKDFIFLIIGFVAYFVTLVAAAYMKDKMLYIGAFGMVFVCLFASYGANLIQQYNLKDKLTVTVRIVPDDPENSRPVTLRFEDVKFGTGLGTPEEFIDFLHKNNKVHLTHSFVSETNGEAKEIFDVMKKRDTDMKIYPMICKKDPIPMFLQSPSHPREELMAVSESVRLSFGRGKIIHGTITVWECEPIRTSIMFKNKIIDVSFALYTLYDSQKKLEESLKGASWHVPTRLAQEAANFTKKKIDSNRNESYYGIIERERDVAVQGRKKLQMGQDVEIMNTHLDGDMRIRTGTPQPPYNQRDVVFGLVFAFVFGYLAHLIIGG